MRNNLQSNAGEGPKFWIMGARRSKLQSTSALERFFRNQRLPVFHWQPAFPSFHHSMDSRIKRFFLFPHGPIKDQRGFKPVAKIDQMFFCFLRLKWKLFPTTAAVLSTPCWPGIFLSRGSSCTCCIQHTGGEGVSRKKKGGTLSQR